MQSLRKHRIIRSNILQTIKAELRTAAAFATRLLCLTGLAAGTFGSGFADDSVPSLLLPPAVPSVSNSTPDSGATDETLRLSRALINSLRAEPVPDSNSAVFASAEPVTQDQLAAPSNVPPIPTEAQLRAGRMSLNNRFRLSFADEESGLERVLDPVLPPMPTDERLPDELNTTTDTAGKVTLPNKTPHEQPSYLQPLSTGKKIRKLIGMDGTIFRQNLRKGTVKVKRSAGRFIEHYDPELECFDPDDYHMPILLVSDSEEQPAAESEERSGLLSRKLSDIQPTLSYAWGDWQEDELPDNFNDRMDNGPYTETLAPRTVLQWAPTNLWYYPLYFQDVGLERYGHTRKPWVQPFVSSGRFFGQVVGLPYQMVLHPPKSREFALGYYQPGEWAPKKRYTIPFNEEAAATEFLWVTGIILLIP